MSKDQELRVHLVEIAIGILRADPKEDVVPARGWALDVIEQNSGVKFSDEDRQALLHKPLATINFQLLSGRMSLWDMKAVQEELNKATIEAIKKSQRQPQLGTRKSSLPATRNRDCLPSLLRDRPRRRREPKTTSGRGANRKLPATKSLPLIKKLSASH